LQNVDTRVEDPGVRATQETYTHGHAESVLRSHLTRTVDNSAAFLAGHLHPGAAVLDVGCGPGSITLDIASRVARGMFSGSTAQPASSTGPTRRPRRPAPAT
jgi:hypothetical protein